VDDAIVSALSAVGEIMPASVRDHLVAASNWCWRRRLGKIDEPDLVGRWIRRKLVIPHHESLLFDNDAPTLKDILEGWKLMDAERKRVFAITLY
jgi:hypothetical protein